MSRDHRKLYVFQRSDELVLEVYAGTVGMPVDERFGLQAQIRRAAVSVPTNIVEGAARTTLPDYQRFLTIALGSARECEYLLTLARRLRFVDADWATARSNDYGKLAAALILLSNSLTPGHA
jgi:four helix bundle protein